MKVTETHWHVALAGGPDSRPFQDPCFLEDSPWPQSGGPLCQVWHPWLRVGTSGSLAQLWARSCWSNPRTSPGSWKELSHRLQRSGAGPCLLRHTGSRQLGQDEASGVPTKGLLAQVPKQARQNVSTPRKEMGEAPCGLFMLPDFLCP